eukprot:364763-Chlamydomonas_euryale.AAC.1
MLRRALAPGGSCWLVVGMPSQMLTRARASLPRPAPHPAAGGAALPPQTLGRVAEEVARQLRAQTQPPTTAHPVRGARAVSLLLVLAADAVDVLLSFQVLDRVADEAHELLPVDATPVVNIDRRKHGAQVVVAKARCRAAAAAGGQCGEHATHVVLGQQAGATSVSVGKQVGELGAQRVEVHGEHCAQAAGVGHLLDGLRCEGM